MTAHDALALTETQKMIQDTVRDYAQKELSKRAIKADEEGKFPIESFQEMAELGLTGIPVPEDLGGAGADTMSYILAVEEIAKVCPSTALTLAAHTSLGTMPIVEHGTDEQKKQFVPPLATGKYGGALCLTEPDTGSDVASSTCYADKKGDKYIVRGTKMYVTNGSFSGSFVISAVTDRNARGSKRLTAIVVERDAKGIEILKDEDKLGVRGSATSLVAFEGVEVPVANRLLEESQGFKVFMPTLNAGRISIAALAVGIAEGAKQRALQYSKERKQFDKPLAEIEAIQAKLADMETEIHGVRLMTYHSARLKDMGREYFKESAMAKLQSAIVAMRVTREAIQILGGYGYMQEYEVERFYRDAKLCEIGEGTNEIQRLIVARTMIGKL